MASEDLVVAPSSPFHGRRFIQSMMIESENYEILEEAIEIAKGILSSEVDPNEGCSRIDDIGRALNWPKELLAFGLLSHEQNDHEHIGITSENCVPDIVYECQKLVAENG